MTRGLALSELDDLLEAARAAPRSGGVVRAMLRAAGASVDPAPALDWLEAQGVDGQAAETQALASALLLKGRRLDAALAWAASTLGPASFDMVFSLVSSLSECRASTGPACASTSEST